MLPYNSNVVTIAETIEEWLEKTRLSKYAVAKRSGIGQSHLYKILNGEFGVTQRTIDRLALAFGVSASEFLAGPAAVKSPASVLSEVNAKLNALAITEVPILGHGPAGEPMVMEEQPEGYAPVPTVELQGVKNAYALTVSGESLAGDGIHHGDNVIVSPDAPFVSGKIYVVGLDNQRVLKHVERVDGKMRLRSSNGKYADMEPERVEILGRVILSGTYRRH